MSTEGKRFRSTGPFVGSDYGPWPDYPRLLWLAMIPLIVIAFLIDLAQRVWCEIVGHRVDAFMAVRGHFWCDRCLSPLEEA